MTGQLPEQVGGVMATNPYDYPEEVHRRCGENPHVLDALEEGRIEGAMHEFRLAFGHASPSGEAVDYSEKIRGLMGIGPTQARIADLTDTDLVRLSEAFWALDRKVQRAYYEADHGK